ARAVHARIWPEADERSGLQGDASLRVSYHQVLKELLPTPPNHIVDLGCSTGRSSFALQKTFPAAQIIGVDLSPHFSTVAQYQVAAQHQAASQSASRSRNLLEQADLEQANPEEANPEQTNKDSNIRWVHAAAEATGLPAESADLVSACLVFHELPIAAAQQIVAEAYRLIRPGGHFAIMDMNPQSETFTKMQPYVLTLLKSTEPFLDQYLTLDIAKLLKEAGFSAPSVARNTPRHRTIVAYKKE
ncbi:MAG: class I SAM-dependent methyltransferase, partial [Phormidesmis sp.]